MSAYMVSRGHVAFLVEAGLQYAGPGESVLYWYNLETGRRLELARENAAEVGQLLWDANRESIQTRYPDTIESWPDAPGPIGEDYQYAEHVIPPSRTVSLLTGRPVVEVRPLDVLAAIRCFDYQACEYEGWRKSDARAYLDRLQAEAIRKLPGMDDTQWGAPKLWESIGGPKRSAELAEG